MKFTLLGSGAVRPDLEHWGPAQIVQVGEQNLLFDCGRGATMRLVEAGIPIQKIRQVFFTHHHYDHNCDFAYLFLTSWVLGRGFPMEVIGPRGTEAFCDGLFFSYKTMANQYSIPIYKTKNINSANSLNLIKDLNPDLLVSIFFNQILSKKLLDIPQDCINIHPAYLPSYKGVSPVFWALANDEPCAGVTVHYIDEGIDTGEIIYQEEIPISPNDTEHSLYFKCCEVGTPLLLKALMDVESGSVKPINKDTEGSYFSLPTKQAVRQFRKNGRKFFRLRNLKLAFKDYK